MRSRLGYSVGTELFPTKAKLVELSRLTAADDKLGMSLHARIHTRRNSLVSSHVRPDELSVTL